MRRSGLCPNSSLSSRMLPSRAMHASGNPACRLAFAPDMRLYHVGSPQRQIANFDSPGRRLVRVSVPQSCWEPLNHPGRLKVFRRFKCRCAAVRLRATLSDPMKIDSLAATGHWQTSNTGAGRLLRWLTERLPSPQLLSHVTRADSLRSVSDLRDNRGKCLSRKRVNARSIP